ncbi:MAG: hypothetical protein K2N32_00605 [Clostridia bacterium]|nr:hypothetical protein [Clostridia bacterium]
MKKILSFIAIVLCLVMTFSFVACNSNDGGENPPDDYTRPSNANIDNSFTVTSKTLVAYFSKTNTTKGVAEKIRELSGADIFEIDRKEPYPSAYTPTTEVAKEEKDNNARPELATYLPDEAIAEYDTIILGFPIWWHTAPMAVLSFLNYYDLSGKTIYTFATSGGSPISESTADIRSNTKATVNEGRLFNRSDENTIRNWLDGLGLIATLEQPSNPNDNESNDSTEIIPPQDDLPSEKGAGVLVVYFSATGSTKRVAEYIADATGGDMFELVPVDPYTGAYLNYNNSSSRVSREHNDVSLRNIELTNTAVANWADYDTVFIGYPIWWGIAAWPVNNFIKDNDFTGKTVIPFATSASSGLGQSGTLLAEMAGTGNWLAGQRFSSGTSEKTVLDWLSALKVL